MNKTLTAAERATIMDACQSISRSADALKSCHTVDGDWGDDLDAKAFYDAELRLLGRLTTLLDHLGHPEPRIGATDGDPVSLEGLRAAILTPRPIVRDEDGMLSHPAVPYLDEDVNYHTFFAAFGIESAFIHMENDVDCDTYDQYFASNSANCSFWTPSAPAGDGWLLLEIYDTEDGPVALFVREKKRESNRERWKREEQEARAAEVTPQPAAIYQILTEEGAWLDTTLEYYERVKSDPALARVVYVTPQKPAQADVRVALTDEQREVMAALIELTRATFIAFDDSEEQEGPDGRQHAIDSANFDAVSNALDRLEELPDDKPGYTLDAAGKAEWALRTVLADHHGRPEPSAAVQVPCPICGGEAIAHIDMLERVTITPEPRVEVTDDLAMLRNALTSINGIRNSIIGLHTLNWSEHVYPLVAALDAAGFEGMEYPEARAFYGTMLDRCNAAEKDADRYRRLRRGQHWSVINGVGDTLRADELDAAIDAARAGEPQ
ncbi:hypothetical protein [Burkholderia ambifaria]|uniref:hypothetical protein n=1 Tax=Burkholderia ambifaria TaxID=152480 RepID=UPI001B8EDF7F|nr:hypothetical protein [Burkholderia ambifaria]MBR7929443.1 hypothetical protein [Burkholderia ambifaria]